MREVNLFTQPISKLYFHYLAPTLISMASSSIYCLADVYFISKGAGSIGLAALNIAMPMFTIFSCIGLVFGVGGATIMSIAEGTGNRKERDQAFTMSIVGMFLAGGIVMALTTIFVEPLAYAFGSSERLLPYVKQYMIPVNLSSIIFIYMYACSILLRNDHAPKQAMKATLIGNISNIFLDFFFVIVLDMGMFGAAAATALGASINVICVLPHFIKKRNTVHFTRDFFSFSLLKRVLSNGFGSGIMEVSGGIIIIVFNLVIMHYADEMFLAAYAIVTNIAYVCKGIMNGFAQAAQPIISANYGAQQRKRVHQAFRIAMIYSCSFALLLYILFLLFPQQVAGIFANHDQVLIQASVVGVRSYFSNLIFMAGATILLNTFQAVECGKLASILAVLKGFVFVIVALYLLLHLFGIDGIWFSVTMAEALALICSIWMMKRWEII